MVVDLEAMGMRIRRRRLEKELTQEQFADKIGLSRVYYNNVERGRRMPSLEVLMLIVNELGVSFDFVLRDSLKIPYRKPLTLDEIYALRSSMTEQQLAMHNWLMEDDEDELMPLEENEEVDKLPEDTLYE